MLIKQLWLYYSKILISNAHYSFASRAAYKDIPMLIRGLRTPLSLSGVVVVPIHVLSSSSPRVRINTRPSA